MDEESCARETRRVRNDVDLRYDRTIQLVHLVCVRSVRVLATAFMLHVMSRQLPKSDSEQDRKVQDQEGTDFVFNETPGLTCWKFLLWR